MLPKELTPRGDAPAGFRFAVAIRLRCVREDRLKNSATTRLWVAVTRHAIGIFRANEIKQRLPRLKSLWWTVRDGHDRGHSADERVTSHIASIVLSERWQAVH